MLEGRYHQGFSNQRLSQVTDAKIRQDENGFYMMSISEDSKVYFEDYYKFMEMTYHRALFEKERIKEKLATLPESYTETIAYLRAKAVIIDVLLKNVRRFYTDGSNLGVVMTPWCFGTVMLEKIEVYRDRISRGEVQDENIPDYLD